MNFVKGTFAVVAFTISMGVHASEYCEKQFTKDVGQSNKELAAIFDWQRNAQTRALNIRDTKSSIDTAITNLINSTAMSDAAKLQSIKEFTNQKAELTKEEDQISTENTQKVKRIGELRGTVPQFQKKAEDCAKEVAPANLVVNLVIQGLAAYFTDGASLMLQNKKALYVDMGEVLKGNPLGGEHSAPNEIKNWINGRLGIHL